MQTQLTPRDNATQDALCRFTGRLLTEIQTRRPIRLASLPRRRETCLTRRAKIAALREAEFYNWLNDADDFTGAMHPPVA